MARSAVTAALVAAVMTLVLAIAPAAAAGGGEPSEPSEAVGGRLVHEGEPVEGVEIRVADASGEEVGDAVSDEDGRWEVAVAGPGTYTVTLVVDSLPEGVELRDEDRSTLPSVRVREGRTAPAVFQLGEPVGGGAPSRFERLLNLTVDGLRFGLVIAIAAVGLSLIYGVTGLTNFAHGELVTLGGLVAWWLSSGGPDLALPIAGVAAVGVGGGFGWVQERGLFAPLRRRRSGNISLIVVTIGLGLFLRNLFLILYGGRPRPYDQYATQVDFDIGPIGLRPKDYAVMVIAAVVLAGYGLLLQRTRLGTGVRAVADNRDLAEASGIDVAGIIRVTWIIGGGLAALGGVLQGLSENVTHDMGFTLLLLMFAAVVLGGIGTAYGSLVGGLVIGVACQVSTYWLDSKWRIGVGLAVLIIVVLVRPQGILGRRERIG